MKNLKLLLFFIALTTIIGAKAQLNIDPDTKKVQYQETIQVDSADKKMLYDRGSEWLIKTVKTNKFDLNDKANYKIAHDGEFSVSYTYDFKYKSLNTVIYTITMEFKDGKYRYTITDFRIFKTDLGAKTAQPLEAYYQKMKTESKKEFSNNFNTEVNKVIEDLKKAMSAVKKETGDDW